MEAHASCWAVGLMPTTTFTSKTSRSTKSSVPLSGNVLGWGVPLFFIRPFFCGLNQVPMVPPFFFGNATQVMYVVYVWLLLLPKNKLNFQYGLILICSIVSLPQNTCIGVPLTTTDPQAGIPEPCEVADGKGDKAAAVQLLYEYASRVMQTPMQKTKCLVPKLRPYQKGRDPRADELSQTVIYR